MRQLLTRSRFEREQIFQEAAARHPEIESPIIMEKDFWVCWALEQIFSTPDLKNILTFKGGTSLSKCFQIIKRFSEDCDLTLERQALGITEENDPCNAPTKKQRKKRLKNLNSSISSKISTEIYPRLVQVFKTKLSDNFSDETWRLEADPEDAQSLLFVYPESIQPTQKNIYIEPRVKLEFGCRGDTTPCEPRTITPYIFDSLPLANSNENNTPINTLDATRTFWEKITLLHAEYHRPKEKKLPKRLFRHYYDVVQLDEKYITNEALADPSLLEKVLDNKQVFFRSAWANYESAKLGTIKLAPNNHFLKALKADCKDMNEMFFCEPPSFESTIEKILKLEEKINRS